MGLQGTEVVIPEVIESQKIKMIDIRRYAAIVDSLDAASRNSITDAESYQRLSATWGEVKRITKELKAARKEKELPVKETLELVGAPFKFFEGRLADIDARIRKEIERREIEDERKRREEERRLKEIADREAEKERAKLEKKAEKAIEKGNSDKAAELQQQAAMVQPVNVTAQRTVEKPTGVAFKETWRAVVKDETKVPRQFLSVDQKKLDKFAQAMKGQIPVDGVVFICEKKSINRG